MRAREPEAMLRLVSRDLSVTALYTSCAGVGVGSVVVCFELGLSTVEAETRVRCHVNAALAVARVFRRELPTLRIRRSYTATR